MDLLGGQSNEGVTLGLVAKMLCMALLSDHCVGISCGS
jgi:hypothetical protein